MNRKLTCAVFSVWSVCAAALAETVPGVKVEYVHHKEPNKVFAVLHEPGIVYDGWTPLRKFHYQWDTHPTAIRWSGNWNVTRPGAHQLRTTYHHWGTFKLMVGGQDVPMTKTRKPNSDLAESVASVELAAGSHPFVLFVDTTYPQCR